MSPYIGVTYLIVHGSFTCRLARPCAVPRSPAGGVRLPAARHGPWAVRFTGQEPAPRPRFRGLQGQASPSTSRATTNRSGAVSAPSPPVRRRAIVTRAPRMALPAMEPLALPAATGTGTGSPGASAAGRSRSGVTPEYDVAAKAFIITMHRARTNPRAGHRRARCQGSPPGRVRAHRRGRLDSRSGRQEQSLHLPVGPDGRPGHAASPEPFAQVPRRIGVLAEALPFTVFGLDGVDGNVRVAAVLASRTGLAIWLGNDRLRGGARGRQTPAGPRSPMRAPRGRRYGCSTSSARAMR